jgi:hypothetical protein
MAENEILDLGGSRWKRTRAALAAPDCPLTDVAGCIVEDLKCSLQQQLIGAFQRGQTLLTILRASGDDPSALKLVVENFRGQGLARIARDAIKATPSKDINEIATCAAAMLMDASVDKALRWSARYQRFQTQSERAELGQAVHRTLDACRSEIAGLIRTSLSGQRVRRQRRTVSSQVGTPVDARMMVRTPLVITKSRVVHASRHP